MNLLLLTDDDRVEPGTSRYIVRDRRHEHLTTVLNAEIGRSLRVGLWDGPKGSGRVVRIESDRSELDVTWTEPVPPRPPVHLIVAIPRPKSLKKLLPEVVALGLGRLTLLRSWRVALPYLSSPLLQPLAQRPLIMDGLMQAGCTRPPLVEVVDRFRPFIDDVARHLPAPHKWVCHPSASHRLSGERPGQGPVVVAIGPEGGWLPYEVDAFQEAGFRGISFGDRILRVETACVAVLANLSLLRSM